MGWHRALRAALLPGLAAAALTQEQTNGNSVLGTADAPLLPQFLTNNPLPHGFPWGTLTANGTNAYKTHPVTGVIRSYDFTVSRGTLAPDGYAKSMILVNGAFPGPTIEANWGDTIQVTVHNNITGPEEGTTLHWHGFLQQGTPWEDGVPANSQCPIAPGGTFTYQFQASLYGTAWYHSHYSGQYGDGALGAIVIHGPSQYGYDVDVGPVLLSDYYRTDYLTLLERMLAPGGSPIVPSDNNLIQGKGVSGCTAGEVDASSGDVCVGEASPAVFHFARGKVHRLRLINPGSEAIQRFSIDNHTLTVVAYDFVPIQPYTTTVVTLGVGQRADVLVRADAADARAAAEGTASFWMRSAIAPCSAARQPDAKAAVYYVDAAAASRPTLTAKSAMAFGRFGGGSSHYSGGSYGGSGGSGGSSSNADSTVGVVASTIVSLFRSLPTSLPWPEAGIPSSVSTTPSSGDNGNDAAACADDDLRLTQPLFPIPLPAPSWTHTMDIGMYVNASNVTLWTFDGVSFRGNYNAPTLLLASLGNTTWPAEWNGRSLYSNSSVRLIIVNDGPSQHPMHLHGANFYVLHEGSGAWDGTIVNPRNPMRRDVQIVRPHGHLVLQFDSTNPGVWPFHCHIAWHASGGFLVQFVVQPDALRSMRIPSIMAQTCRDWAAWTGTHIPDQIDSGL